jgi:hypothetical protein
MEFHKPPFDEVLDNNFASSLDILAFAQEEDRINVRKLVLDKVCVMSDVFSPYSYEDR